MVTEDLVRDKLKTVLDPELNINVVDLGLIYKIEIVDEQPQEVWMPKGKLVKILMTLTSPACPLAETFDELVGGAIRNIEGVGRCEIEITFDPPWSGEKMSEEARLELGRW